MLKKKNRVNTKTVKIIFTKGCHIESPNFSFKYIFSKEKSTPAVSFVVPKTIFLKAVKRNFFRRKGYTVLAPFIKNLPTNLKGVFVLKKKIEQNTNFSNEIKKIINKIN